MPGYDFVLKVGGSLGVQVRLKGGGNFPDSWKGYIGNSNQVPRVVSRVIMHYDKDFRQASSEPVVVEGEFPRLRVYSVDLEASFEGSTWEGVYSGSGGLENLIRVLTAIVAPHHGHVLVHSSSVVVDSGGIIFPGPSGSGKTTISRIFKERCYTVLNDDLSMVEVTGSGILISSTPFGGIRSPVPTKAELNMILFPVKSSSFSLVKCNHKDAYSKMLTSIPFVHTSKNSMEMVLSIVGRVISQTRSFYMNFDKQGNFVKIFNDEINRRLGV